MNLTTYAPIPPNRPKGNKTGCFFFCLLLTLAMFGFVEEIFQIFNYFF